MPTDASPAGARKNRAGPLPFIAAALGAVLVAFALLFAMANDEWTAVSVPSAPWSAAPRLVAFEARLWAIMAFCLALGGGIAAALARALAARERRKGEGERARLARAEAEIERLMRLMTARRDKE
ncbi:MAG: hypothetical protein PHU25_11860 [Deltaproteobacteria bacterium]|nr:hypothetical protein [Deltaproteobacteria bacterium]